MQNHSDAKIFVLLSGYCFQSFTPHPWNWNQILQSKALTMWHRLVTGLLVLSAIHVQGKKVKSCQNWKRGLQYTQLLMDSYEQRVCISHKIPAKFNVLPISESVSNGNYFLRDQLTYHSKIWRDYIDNLNLLTAPSSRISVLRGFGSTRWNFIFLLSGRCLCKKALMLSLVSSGMPNLLFIVSACTGPYYCFIQKSSRAVKKVSWYSKSWRVKCDPASPFWIIHYESILTR